ncbi:hypothetical protein [Pseudonocardia sp. ICBG601]|uniref:hypothetical protein n=1 Tax=Pseudonocardia sp. ICBG601 TaxID=2846759 RepID=UPI001CF6F9D4|nr:hypothetical protein [Pseudonocardia sp. ICBG601]
MGVRTVRFCDITGVESDDVVHHELQIDQMRIEIDLLDTEYERLLDVLRPFIDAGRVEASIPTAPTVPAVSASVSIASAPVPAVGVGVDSSARGLGGSGESVVGDTAPEGESRELLADVAVVMAGRRRVLSREVVLSLQQLAPGVYGAWSQSRLSRELPASAKPYGDFGGMYVSLQKVIAARNAARRTAKKKPTKKEITGVGVSSAGGGLF